LHLLEAIGHSFLLTTSTYLAAAIAADSRVVR